MISGYSFKDSFQRFPSRFFSSISVPFLFIILLSACSQRSGDDFFEVERFEAAADQYIEAAEQGDVNKMLRLAEMYAAGKIGYRRDYPQSRYWYQKAAATGVVSAMFELGLITEYGLGRVERDWPQAARWYRQAADQGHAYGQYRLAAVLSRQLKAHDGDAAVQAYRWFLIAERSAQRCKVRPECRLVIDDLFNFQWQLQQELSVQQQRLAQGQAADWQAKVAP